MATTAPSEALTAVSTKAPANRLFVILGFLSIYVIWGSTYLAIRYAVETIPPYIQRAFDT